MNVWMRPRSAGDRLGRLLEVGPGARQARNDRTAHFLGDAVHRLSIGRRGNREPGLDDVHAERIELARQAKLLGYPQGEPWCLFAVAERRVENSDVLCHRKPLPVASIGRDAEDTVKMIIILFGLSLLMRR
jgi:hypothetical protein